MLHFGRESLEQAEDREWLVTNGIGGYSAGTIGGTLTRRYHGLLIAALKPPLQRTLLVTKVEEVLRLGQPGQWAEIGCPLYSDRRRDPQSLEIEEIAPPFPQGDRYLESFSLDRQVPCWRYSLGLTQIEKRVWMAQGENTTYVQYGLVRGEEPITLDLRILVNYRNHHGNTQAHGWRMAINPVDQGLQVHSFPEATPFYLLSPTIALEPAHHWKQGYDLRLERYRGLSFLEDHLEAATARVTLWPQQPVALVFSTVATPNLNHSQALDDRYAHSERLIRRVFPAAVAPHSKTKDPETRDPESRDQEPASPNPPSWFAQLLLAADQFIVDRSTVNPVTQQREPGKTIIAGYPWFGDWGRDTMISLPGLTLVTQRPEIARPILQTFGRYLSQGMLPNVFPESNEPAATPQYNTPQYNTVDATLWYFNAIAHYSFATQDWTLLEELFPALETIVEWHQRGTRYQIHWDPQDGLIYAGEPGVQLTWMDAKVGDWVVTPRQGKPAEINALWYNALVLMQVFAQRLGRSSQRYTDLAKLTRQGFQKFWSPDLGYCFDVLDSPSVPNGQDTALRPNQLLGITLPARPFGLNAPPLLDTDQAKSMLQICGRWLLTSHGLRSLSPQDPQYQGHYGGSLVERDGAYHQGTVWGWWIGIFAEAHFQVYGDRSAALSVLEPMADQLRAQCVGTLGEIFDGDPPFTPRGAFAQAWTVAEVLRVWVSLAS
jgi:glycogen debranching enzyme